MKLFLAILLMIGGTLSSCSGLFTEPRWIVDDDCKAASASLLVGQRNIDTLQRRLASNGLTKAQKAETKADLDKRLAAMESVREAERECIDRAKHALGVMIIAGIAMFLLGLGLVCFGRRPTTQGAA